MLKLACNISAQKKGVGSTESGRDSRIQTAWRKACRRSVRACRPYLSVSRRTPIKPGINVGRGSDDTLFALIDGKVKFERAGGQYKESPYTPYKLNISTKKRAAVCPYERACPLFILIKSANIPKQNSKNRRRYPPAKTVGPAAMREMSPSGSCRRFDTDALRNSRFLSAKAALRRGSQACCSANIPVRCFCYWRRISR